MKKFIEIFLCLVVILSFCSCNGKESISSDFSTSGDEVSKESTSDNSTLENFAEKNKTSSKETNLNNYSSKTLTSTPSKKPNSSTLTSDEDDFVPPTFNGSEVEEIENQIPEIIGSEPNDGNEPVLGEDYGAFLYEGNFSNLATDNNMVYSVFNSPNSIVAFDTDKLELIYGKTLPGRPGEIQVDGNNLLISFPDLKCIKIYNKKSFALVKSISLPQIVSSFCVDGDIIYYSEDNQHCKIFRTNLDTNETKNVVDDNNVPQFFYYPKLLLNKEKGLLYIGESGSSGSKLYYYNTSDFSLHSSFAKDNYGIMNHQRTMFLVNANVFWGGFRFASDNAGNVIGEYTGSYYGTYYADENYVATRNGIYNTETYEYLGNIQTARYMAITANKCLIAVLTSPTSVVIAIPY